MDPPHDNPIPLNESTAADTNNITLQYKDLFLLFIRAGNFINNHLFDRIIIFEIHPHFQWPSSLSLPIRPH